MENESAEDRTLTLEVPAALDGWLTERAAALDVDRSELIVQLIGGYRTAVEATDEEAVAELETAIEERSGGIDDLIEEAVEDAVEEAVAATVPDEEALANRVLGRVDDRLETLEAEREEQLDDIRRRVVQLKQATESKASADHTHQELERLDDIVTEVRRLREQVSELEDAADRREELAATLEDVRGKLTQLARVVVRLREADGNTDDERLAAIRRTAAREGHETAVCGACGETLRIGLLPDPACPHCESPFGDLVADSGGLFGSTPRLVGPHQGDAEEPPEGPDAGADASDIGPGAPDSEESVGRVRAPGSDASVDDGGATDADADSADDTESDDGDPAVSTDGGSDD